MYGWKDGGHKEEPKEATWNEISTFQILKGLKDVTVSELDHEEVPVFYSNVHRLRQNREGLGLDFTPITFLTCFNINTHKGR